MHGDQNKTKQADPVAAYSEKWAKKVSVRKLFPRTLPLFVFGEARTSHKAGLDFACVGDLLLKSLEC